jgi:hypothetical protein
MLCNAKRISSALTSLVAIIAFSSYFGTASRVKATEVRHPTQQHDQGDWLVPTGKGWGKFDSSGMSFGNAQKYARGGGRPGGGGGGSKDNGIQYHGGRVITTPDNPTMYYIWYGSWDFNKDNTKTLLDTFGININQSPYFNINKTYYDANNSAVSGMVNFQDPIAVVPLSSKYGNTSLTDNDVQAIVEDAINAGLKYDPNAVYFVLTSKDVKETSGFCSLYCAWHGYGTRAATGDTILFGFVGDPAQCPSACGAQTTTPNGNFTADSMANLLGHELAEATTDPEISAWFDRRGRENADKCAWKFGTTSTDSNGSKYNVTLGGKNWLLQQNWINSGGGSCTLSN